MGIRNLGIILSVVVCSILVIPALSEASGDMIQRWDRVPAEGGRHLGTVPDGRTQEEALKGLGTEHFGERRGLWPKGGEVSSPWGTAFGATGNLSRARNDLDENGALFAALARFGANPSPVGVARILDTMEAHPVEFWGLVDRAGDAARGGDAPAWWRLYEVVWAFKEAGVVEDQDWDDLGYVLARVIQVEGEDREAGGARGKGDPIFQRPFDAGEGVSAPKGAGTGGKGKGHGVGGWFGGKLGPENPFQDQGLVKDPTKWGKGGVGDGIMGWSDGEKGPPRGSAWVPDIDIGVKPGFNDPTKGGPDGGFYGGINIGKLPGQAGKEDPRTVLSETKMREWNELAKWAGVNAQRAWYRGEDTVAAMYTLVRELARDMVNRWHDYQFGFAEPQAAVIVEDLGGGWQSVVTEGTSCLYHQNGAFVYWDNKTGEGGNMPRPDGEREGDSSPLRDPQLLLQLTKIADRQQNKPEVVPGVVDPMPIDRAGKAMEGGELPLPVPQRPRLPGNSAARSRAQR